MSPATQVLPPVLSMKEFFKAFGISKALFYRLPPEKRPPVIRIGTKPMIRATDAMAWLDRQEAV